MIKTMIMVGKCHNFEYRDGACRTELYLRMLPCTPTKIKHNLSLNHFSTTRICIVKPITSEQHSEWKSVMNNAQHMFGEGY